MSKGNNPFQKEEFKTALLEDAIETGTTFLKENPNISDNQRMEYATNLLTMFGGKEGYDIVKNQILEDLPSRLSNWIETSDSTYNAFLESQNIDPDSPIALTLQKYMGEGRYPYLNYDPKRIYESEHGRAFFTRGGIPSEFTQTEYENLVGSNIDPEKLWGGSTSPDTLHYGVSNKVLDDRRRKYGPYWVKEEEEFSQVVAELAHAIQYNVSGKDRAALEKKGSEEFHKLGDAYRYKKKRTLEHTAHSVIEPEMGQDLILNTDWISQQSVFKKSNYGGQFKFLDQLSSKYDLGDLVTPYYERSLERVADYGNTRYSDEITAYYDQYLANKEIFDSDKSFFENLFPFGGDRK